MRRSKKVITLLLTLVLAIGSLIAPISAEDKFNQEFDDFLTQEFKDMCENDYLTMHYYVSDPAKYGMEKPEPTIGKFYTKEELISENRKSLDKLNKIDYDSLSDRQKHDYSEYKFQLLAAIDQAEYHELDMSFDPGNNIASNIVTNMTEFVFRSNEDIDDYLAVLASVPAYMDQEIEYMKQQANDGIFLTEDQLEKTLEWFEQFTEKKDDNALIVDFNNAMKENESLDEALKNAYIEKNVKIVKEQFIPCYEKIAEELEKLEGSRKYGDRVYDLPNGKEYYEAKMKTYANSERTVEEVIGVCNTYMNQVLTKYMLLLQMGDPEEDDVTVKFKTPEEILKHLEGSLDGEFPKLEQFTYHAEYLDPSIAEENVLAYYMECPIDDPTANSIKINGAAVEDANSLYETLAHEGIAGHMYQRNYYISTDPHPVRLAIHSLGYGEGWAMYAMDLMWDKAGISDAGAMMNRIDLELSYTISAIVDMYVNGLGYNEDQIREVFDKAGLNSDIAANYIDHSELYPMQLVPYGAGLSFMGNFRTKAEGLLDTEFNALEFNTVLLNNGPRYFELIEQDLRAYYESKGKKDSGVDPVEPARPEDSDSSIMPIAIGAGIVAVIIVALIIRRSRRKDDPFEA